MRHIIITIYPSGSTGTVSLTASIADMLAIAETYEINGWDWSLEYVCS